MCVAGKKGGTKPGPFAFIDDVKVFMGGSSKQVLATVDSVGSDIHPKSPDKLRKSVELAARQWLKVRTDISKAERKSLLSDVIIHIETAVEEQAEEEEQDIGSKQMPGSTDRVTMYQRVYSALVGDCSEKMASLLAKGVDGEDEEEVVNRVSTSIIDGRSSYADDKYDELLMWVQNADKDMTKQRL